MLTRQNLQENNFLLAVTSQNCLRRPLKIIAKSFNQFLRINQFFFSFDILSQYNENKKIQIITLRYFVDTNLPIWQGVVKFGLTPDLYTPCPKTVAIAAKTSTQTCLYNFVAMHRRAQELFLFFTFLDR